jgi:hypothetical protein
MPLMERLHRNDERLTLSIAVVTDFSWFLELIIPLYQLGHRNGTKTLRAFIFSLSVGAVLDGLLYCYELIVAIATSSHRSSWSDCGVGGVVVVVVLFEKHLIMEGCVTGMDP